MALGRAALAVAVLGTAALVTWFGLDHHVRLNDEMLAVFGGRRMELSGISALWHSTGWERGPERLNGALIYAVNRVFGGTEAEFQGAHALWALLWALTAVPTYLVARRMGVPALGAVAAAVIAVAGPSAVFGTTLLNTAPGFLTLTATYAAAWWTALHPSRRADAAVLVLAGLAISARVGHAPFLLPIVPAILRATWRTQRMPGRRLTSELRAFPASLVRRHGLLVAAGVLALAVLAVKGQQQVLGGYGSQITSQHLTLSHLWDRAQVFAAHLALESGVIPFAIGVPWLLRELVRPRSDDGAVLATLTAGGAAVLLYVFYNAPVEDRYLAIALPAVVVAAATALTRREASPVAAGVLGLVMARAITQVGISPDVTGFAFIIEPAGKWLDRAVAGNLTKVLPAGDAHATTLVLLALVAAAVLATLAARRRPPRAPAVLAVLTVGLIAYQVLGAGYAMRKFTTLAGNAQTPWSALTFVDRATTSDVAYLSENRIGDPGLIDASFDTSYFNRGMVVSAVEAGEPLPFTCCQPNGNEPVRLEIDRHSGRIGGGERLPRDLVVPPTWVPYSLRSTTVAEGAGGFRLERRAPGPPRLAQTTVGGIYADGWGRPHRAIRLRAFDAAPGTCLRGIANTPPGSLVDTPVRFAGTAREQTLPVAANTPTPFSVPLRAGTTEVHVTAPAVRLDSGRRGTVRLDDVRVAPC